MKAILAASRLYSAHNGASYGQTGGEEDRRRKKPVESALINTVTDKRLVRRGAKDCLKKWAD